MKLSKRGSYAVQAAVRLATHDGAAYLQSKEIAHSEQLPAKFLESVLLSLKSAEILESKVGAGGGYRLAKDADKITVQQVIGAVSTDSGDAESEDAQTEGQHALTVLSERLDGALTNALGGITIDELAEQSLRRMTGDSRTMYYI